MASWDSVQKSKLQHLITKHRKEEGPSEQQQQQQQQHTWSSERVMSSSSSYYYQKSPEPYRRPETASSDSASVSGAGYYRVTSPEHGFYRVNTPDDGLSGRRTPDRSSYHSFSPNLYTYQDSCQQRSYKNLEEFKEDFDEYVFRSSVDSQSQEFLDENELKFKGVIQTLADEQERVQQKVFMNWINHYVPNCIESNIIEELRDGTKLIALINALTGETIPAERGRRLRRHHFLSNVQRVLDFLESRGLNLINIHALDIVDGNPRIILGLIWIIILRFHIEEYLRLTSLESSTNQVFDHSSVAGSSTQMKSPQTLQRSTSYSSKVVVRKSLMDSIKNKFGMTVTDFGRSWRDGENFLMLIDAIYPKIKAVEKGRAVLTNRARLRLAFDLAEKHFGVKPLLDAEDIDVPNPDERSIMTYVTQILQSAKTRELQQSTQTSSSESVDHSTSAGLKRRNEFGDAKRFEESEILQSNFSHEEWRKHTKTAYFVDLHMECKEPTKEPHTQPISKPIVKPAVAVKPKMDSELFQPLHATTTGISGAGSLHKAIITSTEADKKREDESDKNRITSPDSMQYEYRGDESSSSMDEKLPSADEEEKDFELWLILIRQRLKHILNTAVEPNAESITAQIENFLEIKREMNSKKKTKTVFTKSNEEKVKPVLDICDTELDKLQQTLLRFSEPKDVYTEPQSSQFKSPSSTELFAQRLVEDIKHESSMIEESRRKKNEFLESLKMKAATDSVYRPVAAFAEPLSSEPIAEKLVTDVESVIQSSMQEASRKEAESAKALQATTPDSGITSVQTSDHKDESDENIDKIDHAPQVSKDEPQGDEDSSSIGLGTLSSPEKEENDAFEMWLHEISERLRQILNSTVEPNFECISIQINKILEIKHELQKAIETKKLYNQQNEETVQQLHHTCEMELKKLQTQLEQLQSLDEKTTGIPEEDSLQKAEITPTETAEYEDESCENRIPTPDSIQDGYQSDESSSSIDENLTSVEDEEKEFELWLTLTWNRLNDILSTDVEPTVVSITDQINKLREIKREMNSKKEAKSVFTKSDEERMKPMFDVCDTEMDKLRQALRQLSEPKDVSTEPESTEFQSPLSAEVSEVPPSNTEVSVYRPTAPFAEAVTEQVTESVQMKGRPSREPMAEKFVADVERVLQSTVSESPKKEMEAPVSVGKGDQDSTSIDSGTLSSPEKEENDALEMWLNEISERLKQILNSAVEPNIESVSIQINKLVEIKNELQTASDDTKKLYNEQNEEKIKLLYDTCETELKKLQEQLEQLRSLSQPSQEKTAEIAEEDSVHKAFVTSTEAVEKKEDESDENRTASPASMEDEYRSDESSSLFDEENSLVDDEEKDFELWLSAVKKRLDDILSNDVKPTVESITTQMNDLLEIKREMNFKKETKILFTEGNEEKMKPLFDICDEEINKLQQALSELNQPKDVPTEPESTQPDRPESAELSADRLVENLKDEPPVVEESHGKQEEFAKSLPMKTTTDSVYRPVAPFADRDGNVLSVVKTTTVQTTESFQIKSPSGSERVSGNLRSDVENVLKSTVQESVKKEPQSSKALQPVLSGDMITSLQTSDKKDDENSDRKSNHSPQVSSDEPQVDKDTPFIGSETLSSLKKEEKDEIEMWLNEMNERLDQLLNSTLEPNIECISIQINKLLEIKHELQTAMDTKKLNSHQNEEKLHQLYNTCETELKKLQTQLEQLKEESLRKAVVTPTETTEKKEDESNLIPSLDSIQDEYRDDDSSSKDEKLSSAEDEEREFDLWLTTIRDRLDDILGAVVQRHVKSVAAQMNNYLEIVREMNSKRETKTVFTKSNEEKMKPLFDICDTEMDKLLKTLRQFSESKDVSPEPEIEQFKSPSNTEVVEVEDQPSITEESSIKEKSLPITATADSVSRPTATSPEAEEESTSKEESESKKEGRLIEVPVVAEKAQSSSAENDGNVLSVVKTTTVQTTELFQIKGQASSEPTSEKLLAGVESVLKSAVPESSKKETESSKTFQAVTPDSVYTSVATSLETSEHQRCEKDAKSDKIAVKRDRSPLVSKDELQANKDTSASATPSSHEKEEKNEVEPPNISEPAKSTQSSSTISSTKISEHKKHEKDAVGKQDQSPHLSKSEDVGHEESLSLTEKSLSSSEKEDNDALWLNEMNERLQQVLNSAVEPNVECVSIQMNKVLEIKHELQKAIDTKKICNQQNEEKLQIMFNKCEAEVKKLQSQLEQFRCRSPKSQPLLEKTPEISEEDSVHKTATTTKEIEKCQGDESPSSKDEKLLSTTDEEKEFELWLSGIKKRLEDILSTDVESNVESIAAQMNNYLQIIRELNSKRETKSVFTKSNEEKMKPMFDICFAEMDKLQQTLRQFSEAKDISSEPESTQPDTESSAHRLIEEVKDEPDSSTVEKSRGSERENLKLSPITAADKDTTDSVYKHATTPTETDKSAVNLTKTTTVEATKSVQFKEPVFSDLEQKSDKKPHLTKDESLGDGDSSSVTESTTTSVKEKQTRKEKHKSRRKAAKAELSKQGTSETRRKTEEYADKAPLSAEKEAHFPEKNRVQEMTEPVAELVEEKSFGDVESEPAIHASSTRPSTKTDEHRKDKHDDHAESLSKSEDTGDNKSPSSPEKEEKDALWLNEMNERLQQVLSSAVEPNVECISIQMNKVLEIKHELQKAINTKKICSQQNKEKLQMMYNKCEAELKKLQSQLEQASAKKLNTEEEGASKEQRESKNEGRLIEVPVVAEQARSPSAENDGNVLNVVKTTTVQTTESFQIKSSSSSEPTEKILSDVECVLKSAVPESSRKETESSKTLHATTPDSVYTSVETSLQTSEHHKDEGDEPNDKHVTKRDHSPHISKDESELNKSEDMGDEDSGSLGSVSLSSPEKEEKDELEMWLNEMTERLKRILNSTVEPNFECITTQINKVLEVKHELQTAIDTKKLYNQQNEEKLQQLYHTCEVELKKLQTQLTQIRCSSQKSQPLHEEKTGLSEADSEHKAVITSSDSSEKKDKCDELDQLQPTVAKFSETTAISTKPQLAQLDSLSSTELSASQLVEDSKNEPSVIEELRRKGNELKAPPIEAIKDSVYRPVAPFSESHSLAKTTTGEVTKLVQFKDPLSSDLEQKHDQKPHLTRNESLGDRDSSSVTDGRSTSVKDKQTRKEKHKSRRRAAKAESSKQTSSESRRKTEEHEYKIAVAEEQSPAAKMDKNVHETMEPIGELVAQKSFGDGESEPSAISESAISTQASLTTSSTKSDEQQQDESDVIGRRDPNLSKTESVGDEDSSSMGCGSLSSPEKEEKDELEMWLNVMSERLKRVLSTKVEANIDSVSLQINKILEIKTELQNTFETKTLFNDKNEERIESLYCACDIELKKLQQRFINIKDHKEVPPHEATLPPLLVKSDSEKEKGSTKEKRKSKHRSSKSELDEQTCVKKLSTEEESSSKEQKEIKKESRLIEVPVVADQARSPSAERDPNVLSLTKTTTVHTTESFEIKGPPSTEPSAEKLIADIESVFKSAAPESSRKKTESSKTLQAVTPDSVYTTVATSLQTEQHKHESDENGNKRFLKRDRSPHISKDESQGDEDDSTESGALSSPEKEKKDELEMWLNEMSERLKRVLNSPVDANFECVSIQINKVLEIKHELQTAIDTKKLFSQRNEEKLQLLYYTCVIELKKLQPKLEQFRCSSPKLQPLSSQIFASFPRDTNAELSPLRRQFSETRTIRRGFCAYLRRAFLRSLPLQVLLLLLLGAATLIPTIDENYTCVLVNNLGSSFDPVIDYPNGPPPV